MLGWVFPESKVVDPEGGFAGRFGIKRVLKDEILKGSPEREVFYEGFNH
ncbi:hypothetical protein K8352_08115 [Flavobacteriaceae bacterium F89]|uniref:Uncharacterized protein n=1 Tax=Cerina litoralis TaxID=2874477 RepID=A0AAE3JPF0_9FLAO|nr:hypothetical protein [Cerina litoralis]MCG2460709.1 hypothetical protein [Cerina litoralis]